MIAKMKKVSLVMLSAETDEALNDLRNLGVLHLEANNRGSSRLDDLSERRNRLVRSLRTLESELGVDSGKIEETDGTDLNNDTTVKLQFESDEPTATEILHLLDEMQNEDLRVKEEREKLERERDRISPWGAFIPEDIRFLREHGIPVRLYVLSKRKMKSLRGEYRFASIFARGAQTGVVSFDPEPLPDTVEFQIPAFGVNELVDKLSDCDQRQSTIEKNTKLLARYTRVIKTELEEIEDELGLEHARVTVGIDGDLAHVTGFLPVTKLKEIERQAKACKWGFVARDPDEEDIVPTLVENPKPIAIIKPVFGLLGTIPGYREYDISFFFLIFFTLFFAMIIGDAGYGFIFLLGTLWSMIQSKRKKRAVGPGQILLLVLSISTIVWGALTGTWFGSEAIAGTKFLQTFVIERISTFNPRSSETVKYFCFVIGAVQISIAHLWNFISALRIKPRIRAFAQLGWMSMVSGIFFLVLNIVLDSTKYPFPAFALWMIVGGLGFVVVFSQQEGIFFKGLLKGVSGLLTTFLDGISAFGDVISYIRLFAVGLATVEIAKSFNAMAADMGSSVVGIIGAILVLGLGHALNLAMGALSVVVHGVRLNMLEFSGHLGIEWIGIEYDPFKKREQQVTQE